MYFHGLSGLFMVHRVLQALVIPPACNALMRAGQLPAQKIMVHMSQWSPAHESFGPVADCETGGVSTSRPSLTVFVSKRCAAGL